MAKYVVTSTFARRFLLSVQIFLASLILFSIPALAADFTARHLGDYGNVTVMEVSGNYDEKLPDGTTNVAARQAITQEFFKNHKDEYDFLVIFTSFGFKMPTDAVAFYQGIRNDVQGIGLQIFDNSPFYGSNGRLQGTIDMGSMDGIWTDPLDKYFDFTLDTLAHEMLHRWAAHVRFRDWAGTTSNSLIGRDGSHWSYLLDTRGSLEYGNQWQDNGNGTFTAVAARTYYSPLDLYLMGMVDKSKVPPMLLIDNPAIDPTKVPEVGATVSGTPRTVTIDDIIAVEGERAPTARDSQKQFKIGFIYAVSPGTMSEADIQGIETVRHGFLTRYSILTDGQGVVQVASTPKEDLPVNPGILPQATVTRTLPPNIDDGVNWLTSRQAEDGSWTDFALTTERDTAEAVSTLTLFPAAQSQLQSGLQWLESSMAANNDFLARRIGVAVRTGGDASALVQELLSRRNADGGWGSGRNFISNAYDTALAMKALALASYSGQAVIGSAMIYLQNAQNADGGWSGDDTLSTIQPTAAVLTTFNSFRKNYPLENSIDRSIAFLTGKQNPDGGFGNSPSTVYDSAMATMALQEAGADRAVINNGVNYLLGQQSDSGSWQESPYQTALAVRAVWQANVDPDISIKANEISFIPEKVTSLPTNSVVNAVIRNLGRTDVTQFRVAIYNGAVTPEKKIAEQIVALPGQSSITVTFPIPVTSGQGHLFYVAADPDDLIRESNENNNSAAKALLLEPTYDFEVLAADVAVTQNNPVEMGQNVTLTAKIANKGTSDAFNVPVRFYIDEPGAPFDIAMVTVDIPAGGSVVKEVVWKTNKAGNNMPLAVQIDPLNTFNELSEENNKVVTPVSINNVIVTGANLTLSNEDIAVTPDPVNERGSVAMSVTARNNGTEAASDIKVNFYKGVPGTDGVLLGTQTIPSLLPGQSAPVTVEWSPILGSGEIVIFVQLDPDNTIKEIAENDNDAFTTLTVRSLPDLSVSAGSLTVFPSAPKDGDTVSFVVTVQNSGNQDATDVSVLVREGTTIIGTRVIPLIKGNSQETATFDYKATNGIHQIIAVVDPDNRLVEQTRDNNTVARTIGVQNAKLWLSEPYISPNGDGVKDSTRLFFRLEAETAVKIVVVSNKGEAFRTFSGGELNATLGTTITWDGLSDSGMVVKDGEYQIQIRDMNDTIFGSLPVTVDNNRSSLAEAFGTKYFYKKDIGCNATFPGYYWNWLSDDSGFAVSSFGRNENDNKMIFASTEGKELQTIIKDHGGNFGSFHQLPDGSKFSFIEVADSLDYILRIVEKQNDNIREINLGPYLRTGESIVQEWSPDGSALSVMMPSYDCPSWFICDDFDKILIFGDYGTWYISSHEIGQLFEWSPDSSGLAYVTNRKSVYFRGKGAVSSELIYSLPDDYIVSMDWLDSKRILISSSVRGTFIYNVVDKTETKVSSQSHPYLAPDKKMMLFVNSDRADLVGVDGTIVSNVSFPPQEVEYIKWSPGSRYVVLYLAPDHNELYSSEVLHVLNVFDTETGSFVEVDQGAYILSEWFDSNTLVYTIPSRYDEPGALKAYNPLSGSSNVLHVFNQGYAYRTTNSLTVSPLGNHLSWSDPYNQSCPNPSYYISSSLLNLTANLSVVQGSRNIALKGTAMDANFGGWRLEYSAATNPDSWLLIVPPADVPVINDVFATWTPQSEGIYNVRLTVWDKAGNQVVSKQTVSWGLTAAVSNVYPSLNAFSPNGDGVKDTVEIYYTLLAPAHVEFTVYNDNNVAIKRDISASGNDHLSWDGRDAAGNLVSDGKYKIRFLDFEFTVEVDNTGPSVAANLGRIHSYFFPGYADYSHFAYADLTGRIFDANLNSWLIEYGEGENPQEWHEYFKGTSTIAEKDAQGNPAVGDGQIARFSHDDLLFLTGKKLRISAVDFSGNKSSSLVQPIEEKVVLLGVDSSPSQMTLADLQKIFGATSESLKFITETALHSGDSRDFFIYTKLEPGLHNIRAIETLRTPILSRRLQYYKGGWHDAAAAIETSKGNLLIDFDNSGIDGIYAVRLVTVDISGKEYLSNTFLVGEDGVASEDVNPLPMPQGESASIGGSGTITAAFETKHLEVDGCNLVSGRIELPAGNLLVQGAKSVTFGLQTNSGNIHLGNVDLASAHLDSMTVETPIIAEGVYPMKAIFTMGDNTTREILSNNKVFVDRTLPVANINYPADNQKACVVKMTDTQGSWTGIEVGGVVADNIKVKRYELYYGVGDNPASWFPAMTGNGAQARPIAGSLTVNGRIGIWNVSNLNAARLTIRLKVVDEAGNVSCDIKSFAVDNTVPFTALTTDLSLFSPNVDGIADEAKATFQLDENVAIDAKVYGLINGALLETAPARAIVSGRQHLSGTGTVNWDGRNDAGSVVQDGRYGITVSAVDVCGNTVKKWSPVEVDNTPPLVAVSYPSISVPLPSGNVIEVKGTAADLNFRSYTLEAGAGDNPFSWTLIATSSAPVNNGVLGVWNIFGLQGRWTLRLYAEDLAGNKGAISIPVDLGLRSSLVKKLNAAPALISPNGDQKLDVTRIDYEVAEPCQVKLDVFDATGQIVRSQPITGIAAGLHSYSWDGRNEQGITLNDGQYSVKLTANSAADPSVTQTEAVTLTIDNSLPAINISEPAEKMFVNKSDVAIIGSVNDASLVVYSLKLSGPAGLSTVGTGNVNRTDFPFSILKELPDGAYTLTLEAMDRGENQTTAMRSFTLDRMPPKVVLDTPRPGDFFGNSLNVVNVSGSITENNLARYSLRYGVGDNPAVWKELMGGDMPPANSRLIDWKVGPTDNIADGIYTLSLDAVDKAGLEGEAKAKLIIDNTSPLVMISSLKEGDYVRGNLEIKGNLTDANLDKGVLEISEGQCGAAYKWSVLKSFSTQVNNGLLDSWKTAPADGDYCLRLSAVDKSGNKSETKLSFKIDTHPPVAPQLAGKLENKTGILLTWSGNSEPDLAGYNIYIDGAKVNTLASDVKYNLNNLAEGVHACKVKAVDFAGNESEPSNIVELRIDLTGPNVRISSPQDGAKVNSLVDIKGGAFSSDDFKEYRVSIGQVDNPAAWTLIRKSPVPVSSGLLSQWDVSGLSEEAPFVIKLEAEDISGNVSSHQVMVTIDNIPPMAPVILTATVSGPDVAANWNANSEADLAGYLLFRNGKPANATGTVAGSLMPYLVSGTSYLDRNLPDGIYRYFLVALDRAGNMSKQSVSLEVMVDTRPPHTVIVEPAANSRFEGEIPLKVGSPDTDIATVQFQYRKLTDTAWINLGSPLIKTPYEITFDPALEALGYGDYQFQAVAIDVAGKTDPNPAFITATYGDFTPPAAPLNLRSLEKGKDIALSWSAGPEQDIGGYNVYRTSYYYREMINGSVIRDTSYLDVNLDDGRYAYEVTAVDISGNESSPSAEISALVSAPYLWQPFTPVGSFVRLGGVCTAGSTVEIFRETSNGVVATGCSATADEESKFAVDVNNLVLGENRLVARCTDAAGNVSRTSDMVAVVSNDTPSPPVGLSGHVQAYDAALGWQPNLEEDLAGYNVYRNGKKLNSSLLITDGTASASSVDSNDFLSQSANAMDQDASTYWSNEYGTYGQWWQVDFQSAQMVNHLDILWGSQPAGMNENIFAGKDFEIQAWSGYTWITLKNVTGNTGSNSSFDFSPPYVTDKIRIHIYDTTQRGQVRINEIRIMKDNLVSTSALYNDLNLPDGTYGYNVTAVDKLGFESTLSDELKLAVGDVTPPTAPENVTATVNIADVRLSWGLPQSPEPDLVGYNVYRASSNGWIKLNPSLFSGQSYVDASLSNGTYTYRITALDNVGNESIPSNESTVIVAVSAPPRVSDLKVVSLPEGGQITVAWESPGGTAIAYNLYRSTMAGGFYAKLNSAPLEASSHVDSGLINGTTYYYTVTAVDIMGNESEYSAEASGIPADTIAPSRPRLYAPAVPALPLTSRSDEITIAGSTDPAVMVDIFRNGVFVGKVASLPDDISKTHSLPNNIYRSSVSSDGKYMAYVDQKDYYIWIRNLINGETSLISQNTGESVQWAPDGKSLAYAYLDPANWTYYHIAIYDLGKGTSIRLTNDIYTSEADPSWSSDGTKIAFTTIFGVWIKDLDSGNLQQISTRYNASVPRFSPDGKKLSYFVDNRLYLYDLATTASVLVDGLASRNAIDWSPDGTRLAFAKSGNGFVYLYDAGSQTQSLLTDSPSVKYALAWSPDGNEIAYVGKETGSIFSLVKTNLQGERTYLRQNIGYVTAIDWLQSGDICLLPTTNQITLISFKGSFTFADIGLEQGENVFNAVASDDAANKSTSSDEITVIYDNSLLPDLAITGENIAFYPPYPEPGEEVLVEATVRNIGRDTVNDVKLDIYLWDATGSLKLLETTTIPQIAANGAESFSVRANVGSTKGIQTVIAVVDAENVVKETQESNNSATREFHTSDKEEVIVATSLDDGQYSSNLDASVNVTIGNSGMVKDGTVRIEIEDGNGYDTALLDTFPLTVPYGEGQSFNYTWNTGATFAGSYQVHAVFIANDGTTVESISPFAILPDLRVDSGVLTDKVSYGANEIVGISINLKNSGSNYVIPQLKAMVRIFDSADNLLLTDEKTIQGLFPATAGTVFSQWNTGLKLPGSYRVVVEAFSGEDLVSTASAQFAINPVSRINGAVTVEPAVVSVGNNLKTAFTIISNGNVGASGVVKAVIIDPESRSIVAEAEQAVILSMNGSLSGGFTFPTSGLELKKYQVVLQHVSQGNAKSIADASFAVKDGTPPLVTIVAPAAGVPYNASIPIVALISDNAAGVEKGEYRVDDGAWRLLPLADQLQGKYAAVWEPVISDNGFHTVSFRGADRAGNVSAPVSVRIEIRMDSTPPTTSLSIGAPKFEAGSVIIVSGSTPFTLNATDNLSAIARTEYRIDSGEWHPYAPFTLPADGPHTIGYRSADSAGNLETENIFSVFVDNSPPVSSLKAGSDLLTAGTVNTVSPVTEFSLKASDESSGVKNTWYRIDAGQWQLSSGGFTLAGLRAGEHVISFNAVDNVENEEAGQAITVRLISFEVREEIALDPLVLVGPRKHDHDEKGNDCIRAQSDPLLEMLDSLGISYHAARDGDDFLRALRSGRFNVYLLSDDRELAEEIEVGEGVYYGDGIIFIKTRPDNDDDGHYGIFGVELSGESTHHELALNLEESPLALAGTFRTGKAVKVKTISPLVSVFGTLLDRNRQYPAVIYNEYGRGKSLFFTFDLFNLSDRAKAAELLANSINLVKPTVHYLRAQDSVPMRIGIANSAEPFSLELVATIPNTAAASKITPQVPPAGNVITWRQYLDAAEKAKFGYYLNLPDAAGDYTVTTRTGFADSGIYRSHSSHDITLKVEASSTVLLEEAIADLSVLFVPDRADRKTITSAIYELQQVWHSLGKAEEAAENIQRLTSAAHKVAGLSVDTGPIRLQLAELLKIWQRKWYLLAKQEKYEHEKDDRDR